MKVTFSIEYLTRWGESLSVVINDKKHPMHWCEGGIWTISLDKCTASSLKDYTYVVMEDGLVRRTEWIHHSVKAPSRQKTLDIRDSWNDVPAGCPFPRAHQAAMFDRPGFKGAGTAIPVFSLRTAADFGIGEFRDLRPLVDWAAGTGQCIIQLLPVNDTTRKGEWEDSYPYSPVSSFALHPLYIHLQDLGIGNSPAFRKEQAELNAREELDYPKVFQAKMKWLRKAWEKRGRADMDTAAFRRFVKENEDSWLGEYARFCAKRDSLEEDYYRWMQFHLDAQLSEEVAYARSKGVSLKGDLPIGVSGDSADAFFHPELFNLDSSTGAPPDFFTAEGQNWGFPTYNWEAMEKDDYAWWKSRLRHMSRYFDAFRIDHVIGWFRIWEIPRGEKGGLNGHFNPALPYSPEEIKAAGLPLDGLFHEDPRNPGMYQPLISPDTASLTEWQKDRFTSLYNDFFYHRHSDFWKRNALKKLPELLGATGMLACGEDLGMVPDCVPGVMADQAILSLRMRNVESEGPWPYMSVCATSSHDMETLRMTYDHDPEPHEIRSALEEYLNTPSMLAIFPLQDWLALDKDIRRGDREAERINQPADPHHHWRYRLHLDLNDLCKATAWCGEVRSLISASGRAEA